MLKIKDNVDLKELEKFGYEEFKYKYYKDLGKEVNTLGFIKYDWYLIVYKDNCKEQSRLIEKWDCLRGEYGNVENDIQDLIQAGIIEKVVEE